MWGWLVIAVLKSYYSTILRAHFDQALVSLPGSSFLSFFPPWPLVHTSGRFVLFHHSSHVK